VSLALVALAPATLTAADAPSRAMRALAPAAESAETRLMPFSSEAGGAEDKVVARRDDGRRTLRRFFPNLGRAAIGVFSRDNLAPALVGTTATLVGTGFDERVRDRLASEGDDVTATLSRVFGGGVSVALIGSTLAAGRLAHGERFRAATYDMATAAGVSVTYTFALKYATGRERPNEEDDLSFPSGHTSNAFALAAALDGHYGRKVTIPAYGIAVLVGYARLRDGVHWLSDVLAGAALGYIAGRTTVRVNNEPLESGGVALGVIPLLGRDVRGVRLTLAF
jgi:membrane-associated phospholipid phosphatase